MKISTKGRYALRLMLDIALDTSGKPVRIKDIAKRQGLSDKYLEQIIPGLTKAGLLKGIRGPQGGYLLSMRPEDYTVSTILHHTEGKLALVSCLEDEVNQCPHYADCVTIYVWQKISDAIQDVTDHITLADLVELSRNKGGTYTI
ncbi:MAG: RrF2 family transcriptional regulator [Lachnospiraceae bacterium]